MIVIGLTGSIAMGKTTTAAMLRRLGHPVYDADAAVHGMLAAGGLAAPEVAREFPGVAAADGGIDRRKLGRQVFGDPAALRRLEAILHPLVRGAQQRFLKISAARRRPLVILDVPLLFEAGSAERCAAVILVSAPAFLQRQRALRRPGMDLAKLSGIMAQQMPDREKRRRTPFVVETGLGQRAALRQLMAHLRAIKRRSSPDRTYRRCPGGIDRASPARR